MSGLAGIISGPWAILPESHATILAAYSRHLRGEGADVAAIEAKLGRPLENATTPMQIQNGVAVISLEGILGKRMNMLMQISGGTSMQIAAQQFSQALADPSVKSIVLAVDSPGGTVDGTEQLANLIYNARGQKPIISIADGTMASAAFWIGSSADAVYITNSTDLIGSIGIVTEHLDTTVAESQRGVRSTKIKAGKYKQLGSSGEPLGVAEREYLQSMVDENYKLFLAAVARNRDEDVETVASEMADGKVFLGTNAINAGLVDGMLSLADYLAGQRAPAQTAAPRRALATATLTQPGATAVTEPAQDPAPAPAASTPYDRVDYGLVQRAQAYADEQHAIGVEVTPAEAIAHCRGGAAPAYLEASPQTHADEPSTFQVHGFHGDTSPRTVDHGAVNRAKAYIAAQADKGVKVSAADALDYVKAQGAQV